MAAPSSTPLLAPKRIHKLDETVVNKIAAGEIIVRPANAVKEMLENSLDAGATEISITVKNGGLGMIQIQDNGCGIKKEDLAMVCERFTTSKIDRFEDLTSLTSFGFRGEALASISYIARVKIISRTADSVCAFQMEYGLGRPLGPEKPCAGNVGTIIMVDDFFYNNPTRRMILNAPSEEYIRIQEVVTKYAMRFAHVGFSLKKHGEHVADIRTPSKSTTLENCKIFFGNSVARELLSIEGHNEKYHCDVKGYVTNANFSLKKHSFLLFINGRAVDCSKLKKCIELLYAVHLPKHSFPFVYLSLELPPGLIDVNVHPTKAEVRFRFEEEIIAFIYETIQERILTCQESRTFMVQTSLSRSLSQGSSAVDVDYTMPSQPPTQTDPTQPPVTPKQKTDPRKFVRTDSRARTLDAFLRPLDRANVERLETEQEVEGEDDGGTEVSIAASTLTSRSRKLARPISFTSLLRLRKSVEDELDEELRALIYEHKFVGCASTDIALVQHRTRLYALDLPKLTEELFYQIILYDFGNFGQLKLSEPLDLSALLELAMEFPLTDDVFHDQEEREMVAKRAIDTLMGKREMMAEYFSVIINEDKQLVSLPLLLTKYIPVMSSLPVYVARLAAEVDWTEEQACFDTFARITAQFFSFKTEPGAEADKEDTAWKWNVEHVVFPALRTMLLPKFLVPLVSLGSFIMEPTELLPLFSNFITLRTPLGNCGCITDNPRAQLALKSRDYEGHGFILPWDKRRMAAAGVAVTRVVRRCHEGQRSQNLDLSACTLKSFPDAVYFLLRNTRILSCMLEQNQISKIPPKFFFNFNALTVLNLRSNRLSSLPDEVSRIADLRILDISNNRFGEFPHVVIHMPKIQVLLAQENEITEVDTADLKSASRSLKQINLQKNPLSRQTHFQLERFTNERALTFDVSCSPYIENFADVD